MSSEGNQNICTESVSTEQSSTQGTKRKRGRPRKSEYPLYELPQRAGVPPLQSAQGNSGKDDLLLGKHFVGKMTKKYPGFCLITVKVKGNQMLKGWVPDQNNLNPITAKDDIRPQLPILRPSQVQKQVSMQAAPPVPIHLEDVTHAKPLQMRRPFDKTTAKHAIPLNVRPYMGSSGVAAVSVSVSPSNLEMGTLAKQDTDCMMSQSPVAAVPITSVPPVLVSGKQFANQNELDEEKPCNDFQKDSESFDGAKDSSVKSEKLDATLVDDVVFKDSPGGRQVLNVQGTDEVGESSGKDHHVNTTVNDEITKNSDPLKTQNVNLKGVDDSKSIASGDEHEVKVDSK